MKYSVVFLVGLLVVSAPQSECTRKLFDKIRNFFYPSTTTTTPISILPEYEIPQGLGDNNDHNQQYPNGQSHENNFDSSSGYFTSQRPDYQVTSNRNQRPTFPTIVPPPGVIYPGMPMSTVSTNMNGYAYHQSGEQDSAEGQGFSVPSTSNKTSHGQSPSAVNNQPTPEGYDDGPLVFPDSPTYGPNRQTDTGLESTNQPQRRYLEASTTVKTPRAHVPVAVDDGRRVFEGPVKDCGEGKILAHGGICRPAARK